ncbi:sodium/hydrogen exchanger family domain-containing protein [Ditylenchus destructor]|uniref:Sodium/hydrogen exchanger family domain-containing protein n=1 Tax=Ditylenchus destructor TaxID=166010 RepID=A0AAD4NCI6_9BILA|nr:sodium/hydrogen exchanger family domain-containing protein [Ditylenchus destructor]
MDTKFSPKLKNAAVNIINHRETNFILTAIAVAIAIYIALVGIFDRNVIHPLRADDKPQFAPLLNTTPGNFSYIVIGGAPVTPLDSTEVLVCSVFSLFILWIVALILGRMLNYFMLPPLLGMLIAGILFANIPFLKGILIIHNNWNTFLRQTAFILILIRCGIGLDPDALRNSLFICGNLGIVSTTVENEGRGVEKGIPTVALASASIDNIYCVTAFSISMSIVFTTNDDLSYIITRVPVEILIGSLFGILAGLALRSLPRPDAHLAHFTRATLIFAVSLAFYFGTRAIKCEIAGPVAVILACIVAAMRWKIDNHKMTRPEERGLKVLWDLFFLPFLFVLIGLILDFSIFTWDLLGQSLAIIFIGICARILVVFLISLCTNLNIKEQCFLSFCFTPKATVQAALAPILAQHCMEHSDVSDYTQLILQTCVLSILITAPIGQIIIQILGRTMLHKKTVGGLKLVDPFQIGSIAGPGANSKYLLSDRDNRLRLQVSNGNDSNQKPDKTVATVNSTHPDTQSHATFEEINHQAYKLFKEQRLMGRSNRDRPDSGEVTAI